MLMSETDQIASHVLPPARLIGKDHVIAQVGSIAEDVVAENHIADALLLQQLDQVGRCVAGQNDSTYDFAMLNNLRQMEFSRRNVR